MSISKEVLFYLVKPNHNFLFAELGKLVASKVDVNGFDVHAKCVNDDAKWFDVHAMRVDDDAMRFDVRAKGFDDAAMPKDYLIHPKQNKE